MAIKNQLITPVTIGRISIGKRVESNGKQLPQKDDEFHITSNIQKDGQWIVPPGVEEAKSDGKLRSIPVRVMFDTPENNFRSGYACFNNEGRQVCAGDGEKATRVSSIGRQDVECAGHEHCQFGQQNRCKPYARLLISLESMFEKDPLAAFAFRTTGYNSVNALTSRLTQLAALTDGKLSGMACNLVLRAKSTAKSRRQAIYYVDLEPRGSLFDAVASTTEWHKQCADRGINLAALDKAVAAGFAATAYIDSDETMQDEEVAGEFYGENLVSPEKQVSAPSEAFDKTLASIKRLSNVREFDSRRNWINSSRDFSKAQTDTLLDALEARQAELEASTTESVVSDAQPSDAQQETSVRVLKEILAKFEGVEDLRSVPAIRIWVGGNKDLTEADRKKALIALENRVAELNFGTGDSRKAA
jgi:hypothetical protein